MRSWTLPIVAALLAPTSLVAQETTLERYVRTGVEQNLELRAAGIEARQAEALLDEGRSGYLPDFQFDSRFSRAGGGRSSVIPIGDLMNPVYRSLNDLLTREGLPAGFPTISNQTIDFIRSREQETRLRVSQVLWNSSLRNDIRSRRHQSDAGRAGFEATRARLTRDIKIAYHAYANAVRAVVILDDAVALTLENERSSQAFFDAALVTRDQVHRARAERLAVEQDRARAETDRILAASHFNYLLGRESDATIDLDPADTDLTVGSARDWLTAVSTDINAPWIDSIAAAATAGRPELRQLNSAVAAADAGLRAERATRLPNLVLVLDAGIQGPDYGFGEDERFFMASLVASWKVPSGGAERARIRKASLELERMRARRQDVTRQVALEIEAAARSTRLAFDNLAVVREQVTQAESAFRLVSRRREEGLATPLEFLDARASLTSARLSQSITEAELLIRLAELEYASGSDSPPTRTAEEESER